jgi:uncharacterized membrane protein YoaK (UPF0700 family)
MENVRADLLLLTWAAGAMDALSYLTSGVFTANMTGNTVVLGLAIVGPDRSRLISCLTSLAAFPLAPSLQPFYWSARPDKMMRLVT